MVFALFYFVFYKSIIEKERKRERPRKKQEKEPYPVILSSSVKKFHSLFTGVPRTKLSSLDLAALRGQKYAGLRKDKVTGRKREISGTQLNQ